MHIKQRRANIPHVHFAKPKNLEPNAFKKSPEIRQTHSKFARFPESGDKFANMASLVVRISTTQFYIWHKTGCRLRSFCFRNGKLDKILF